MNKPKIIRTPTGKLKAEIHAIHDQWLEDVLQDLMRAAQDEAPIDKGGLRGSAGWIREGDKGYVYFDIEYAAIVHEGSPAHTIEPKAGSGKKALFWKGAAHPVKRVNHPGTEGNKFLERAAKDREHLYEKELAARLRRRLDA